MAKRPSTKNIGLFDHIKHVNQIQSPSYFDTLSDAEKSTWSNWMVLRALSYNPEYTCAVNELQKFVGLPPNIMYKLLIDIFPKNKEFHPFITNKSKSVFNEELVRLIKSHFQISSSQCVEYLVIFCLTIESKSYLINILSRYGKTDKEIKQLLK